MGYYIVWYIYFALIMLSFFFGSLNASSSAFHSCAKLSLTDMYVLYAVNSTQLLIEMLLN